MYKCRAPFHEKNWFYLEILELRDLNTLILCFSSFLPFLMSSESYKGGRQLHPSPYPEYAPGCCVDFIHLSTFLPLGNIKISKKRLMWIKKFIITVFFTLIYSTFQFFIHSFQKKYSKDKYSYSILFKWLTD